MVQHHNDLGHYGKCNRVYTEEGTTVMLDREGGEACTNVYYNIS